MFIFNRDIINHIYTFIDDIKLINILFTIFNNNKELITLNEITINNDIELNIFIQLSQNINYMNTLNIEYRNSRWFNSSYSFSNLVIPQIILQKYKNKYIYDDCKFLLCLPKLETLNLMNCHKIKDVHINFILPTTQIKTIILKHCKYISDHSLLLLSTFKTLTHINISNCYDITDNGLLYLSESSSLTHIDISFCKKITNNGLYYLSKINNY